MKRYHYISLLLLLTLLTSCSKNWLDEKPDINSAIPETLDDCQLLLDNNALFNTRCPALGELASDDHYIVESSIPTISDNLRNAYTWTKDRPYVNVSDWNTIDGKGTYARIFACNLVLETLKKISPINNQNQWNSIKGQALFIRAKSFYELSQVFAPVFQSSNENQQFGIPLRLETNINIPTVRSTLKETYDRIINDLLEAKTLLSNTYLYKTRASRPAAFGMLARVYLSMELYEDANKFADSTLSIINSLIDYNTLNKSLSLPLPKQSNIEVIFHSSLNNYAENTSRSRVNTQLRSSYDVNDLRSGVFFGASAGLVTFKGYYSGETLCFSGIATDEIYLIRAECKARANDITGTMSDLNLLLKMRWNKAVLYPVMTAVDADDALRKVLIERRKELLYRGLRWSDLRRLNRDPRFSETLTRTVAGVTYTLEPNSYKYTFPIPDDIIQITGIQQNPGWNK